ncbi:MAG: hypothetical protein WKF79_04430 [Nocardioides sp.]
MSENLAAHAAKARPRSVATSFGPSRSVTVARQERLDPFTKHRSGHYHGASLTALHKLAGRQGHRLLGCDAAGVIAFFCRRDCANELPDLSPGEAHIDNSWRSAPTGHEAQFQLIWHLPLTEV